MASFTAAHIDPVDSDMHAEEASVPTIRASDTTEDRGENIVIPLAAGSVRSLLQAIVFQGVTRVLVPLAATEELDVMFDHKLYNGIAVLLENFETRGLSMRNVAMARLLPAKPMHSWPLKRKVFDLLKCTAKPECVPLTEGDQDVILWISESKTDRQNPPLLEKMVMDHRDVDKTSFVWFAPAIFFWPPPLTTGPDLVFDKFWEFRLNGLPKDWGLNLALLQYYLAKVFKGYFFAAASHTSGHLRELSDTLLP